MTRAIRALVLITCCSAATALVHAQAGRQTSTPQTFRTGTDVVLVDVSVRKGNTPVTELTAADFELRDNGVLQEVETVETKAVPIDLSILVDVSGDPDRPWTKVPPMSKVAAGLDEEVRMLTRLLREGDRVRLFAIDTYVQQVWPLQAAAAAPVVQRVDFDGMPSLYNTLTAVLLQPVETTRRHVIVAATRGMDSTSSISAAGLRAIAERSDAQMHLVMQEVAADAEATVSDFQCGKMDICGATYRFWVPARRRLFNTLSVMSSAPGARILYPDGLQLQAAALATGGNLYQGQFLSEPTLFNTFEKAFENFRQSYVLRYSARGVNRAGWHQISVTVPRDKSLKIQARTGYAVEALPVPAPPPTPITNTTPLRTLEGLVLAYGRGAYDPVTLNLRAATDPARLILDFDRAGNPWPHAPRREAVFALEVAEAGIYSPRLPARDEATQLLQRFERLVRHPIEPDDFERAWLWAELAMLQGTIRPNVTGASVDRALARFPDEPRFLLARAIVTDQLWTGSANAADAGSPGRRPPSPEHVTALIAQYESAGRFIATSDDAMIRLGWFLHRIGRSEEALAKFDAAEGAQRLSPALGYLRELFRGRVLTSLGRLEDALVAFRRAVLLVPGAQSARVSVMNTLLVLGQRDEAETLAEITQATPSANTDPWWMYWQGDYRRYPLALGQVRALIK